MYFCTVHEEQLKTIEAEPAYLAGAFFSQSHNLAPSMSRRQLQETCFLASVASFIKKQGATCYASPETLLSTYNKHACKFGLKTIGRTTLFAIQARVMEMGLVKNTIEHDVKKGRNWRKFAIDFKLVLGLFSSVFSQAYHRAKACLNRKLNCNRSQESTTKESNNDAGSSISGDKGNWTRATKESKDLKRHKNKKPTGAFFKKRFGKDCDTVYQLQEQARNGSISASGAKLLIGLHHKYSVNLAPAFKAFLNFRIFNAPKQRESMTLAQRSQQRLRATTETRQGNQVLVEPELLALVEGRSEPMRAVRGKPDCQGSQNQRKAPEIATEAQPVVIPAYLSDDKALAAGMKLRRRIQQKLQ